MIENDGDYAVLDDPFPHAILDGYWRDRLLDDVLDEFPDERHRGWKRFANSAENKLEGSRYEMLGDATIELLTLMGAEAPALARAFGTPSLTCEWIGGGYHWIKPGGFLQMHADFNRSPATGRYRWLNMLVYLNRDWQETPGGCLQLWNDEGDAAAVITPEFNRTVVFATSARSWHGHPAPNQRDRRSVAAYFYAAEPPPGYAGDHSTRWHPKVGL